jgi:hypothetical protein
VPFIAFLPKGEHQQAISAAIPGTVSRTENTRIVDPEKVILRQIEVEYCGPGGLAR